MSDTTTTISTELIVYTPGEEQLKAAAQHCVGMKIAGIDDREGYNRVHHARMKLKNWRVAIDKTRKDLKADALEWSRKVDTEAKRLTAIIEPTERILETEQKRIDDDKARIAAAEVEAKRAAERAEQERLRKIQDEAMAAERKKIADERAQLDRDRAELLRELAATERMRQVGKIAEAAITGTEDVTGCTEIFTPDPANVVWKTVDEVAADFGIAAPPAAPVRETQAAQGAAPTWTEQQLAAARELGVFLYHHVFDSDESCTAITRVAYLFCHMHDGRTWPDEAEPFS